MEEIGISWVVGSSVRPKYLKKCMLLNWNFQRGGGGMYIFWNYTMTSPIQTPLSYGHFALSLTVRCPSWRSSTVALLTLETVPKNYKSLSSEVERELQRL